VLYACDVYGRITLPLTAAVFAFLAREARRTRKRPARLPGRGTVTDEEIEAALREWAGDVL
jgi:hypothetical protein